MPSFTVTDTAQPIYPDGQQTAFIIYNQGPYSVSVDSDSSIGSGSIVIPPTGWLAWDEGHPLWVKRLPLPNVAFPGGSTATAPAPSTIKITRNHSAVSFTNSIDQVLGSWIDNKASGVVASPLLECTAFNTLIIQAASPSLIYSSLGEAFALGKSWFLHVHWYDANGNPIAHDQYTAHGYFGDDAGSPDVTAFAKGPKYTIPVKGTYAIILSAPYTGNPLTTSLVVAATTRVLPKRIHSGYQPSFCVPTVNGGASVNPGFDRMATIIFDNLTGGNQFMIPSLTDTIQWAYTTSVGGTAGSIRFMDAGAVGASGAVIRVVADSVIPSQTTSSGIVRVPQDVMLMMDVTPVLSANINAPLSRLNIEWL